MEVELAGGTVTIDADRLDDSRLERFLDRYLDGQKVTYRGGVDLEDLTAFTRNVLSAVRDIPYGQTRTYAGVAAHIGRRDAARAVANACGANPVPLVIPCHRVVASDGIGGYSAGEDVKRHLLELEGAL